MPIFIFLIAESVFDVIGFDSTLWHIEIWHQFSFGYRPNINKAHLDLKRGEEQKKRRKIMANDSWHHARYICRKCNRKYDRYNYQKGEPRVCYECFTINSAIDEVCTRSRISNFGFVEERNRRLGECIRLIKNG